MFDIGSESLGSGESFSRRVGLGSGWCSSEKAGR